MNRRLALLFVAVIAVVIIVQIFTRSRSQDGCEVKVAFNLAESEWEAFKKQIFPKYEQLRSCRVSASQVDADAAIKLLSVSKESGKTPPFDVLAQDNMRLYPLVSDSLVEQLPSDFSDEEKDPHLIAALSRGGVFEGKRYFAAFRPNVQITYYNADKFKQYNLSPPKNWKELETVANTFKAKENVARILLKAYGGAPTATQLYEFILAGEGDPFDFLHPNTKKTFLFLRDLWPAVSKDSLKAKWDTSNDYMANESVFWMQNWPFGFKILREKYKKDNIKVYSGIAGTRRAHVIGGDMLGIPVGIKPERRSQAVDFIRFLQSKETQQTLVKSLGWPSIRSDVYEEIQDPLLREQFVAVNEAMKFGFFRDNVPYWNDYQRIINEVFDRVVVKQQKDYNTLFSKYAAELKEIRDRL